MFADLQYLLAANNQQMAANLFTEHLIHFLMNDRSEISSLSFLEFSCYFEFNYFPIFLFPFDHLTNLYFIALRLFLILLNFLVNFLHSKNYLSFINFSCNYCFKESEKKNFNKMFQRHLIYFATNNCYCSKN
jgi:hypothetical protein